LIDKFCDKILCPIFQKSFLYSNTGQIENSQLKYELDDINNRLNMITMLLNRLFKESNIIVKNFTNYIPSIQSSNLVERKDGYGKVSSFIYIEALGEYFPIECAFCSNFQKIDIESAILTKDSIEALSQ